MDKPKCKFKYIDYVGNEEIPCEICTFKSNEEFEEFEDTYCFFKKEEECPVYKMNKRIEKLEQALDKIENILNSIGEMSCYSKSMCLYEEDIEDILDIIKKAKVK